MFTIFNTAFRRDGRSGFRSVLKFTPVAICNQTCAFCWSQEAVDDSQPYLPTDLLIRLIDDYADGGGGTITFSGGGEPTLHPDLDRIAERLVARQLRYGAITNGLRVTDKALKFFKHAEWIKISLNGIDELQYRKQYSRPNLTHLSKTIENIGLLKRVAKADAIISASMVITALVQGDDDIERFFFKALNDLGVHYILFRPYIGTSRRLRITRTPDDMIGLARRLTRIAREKGVFTNLETIVREVNAPRVETEGKCPLIQAGLMATVTSDGHVHICLPLPRNGHDSGDIGSLFDESFPDLWNGSGHQHAVKRQDNATCPACRYERMFDIVKGFGSLGVKPEDKRDRHWDFI